MKSQVLHTVWCYIYGESAREIRSERVKRNKLMGAFQLNNWLKKPTRIKNPIILGLWQTTMNVGNQGGTYPHCRDFCPSDGVVVDHCLESHVQVHSESIHVHEAKESHDHQYVAFRETETARSGVFTVAFPRVIGSRVRIFGLPRFPTKSRTLTKLEADQESGHASEAGVQRTQELRQAWF